MSLLFIISFSVCTLYMVLNFKWDIQMFQQNSYRIKRYWRWLASDMGSTWRIIDIAIIFMLCSSILLPSVAAIIATITAIVKIILIFRKKYKKPLVFTHRVWRLYTVTSILALGAVIAVALLSYGKTFFNNYSGASLSIAVIFTICALSYFVVILADILLIPVEKMIGRRYINDARRILRSMPDLKIIGITGSFGKTSTKHYLARILSEDFDTLITPGSFNTPMGVVRTIREHLKPYNQIFICEMGAKQVGDIKEICDIVHPTMGIITAVGPMHLETFKSIQNVQKTKFELADTLPADTFIAINNDFKMCADRPVDNTTPLRYGINNIQDCDYYATDVHYSAQGTTFTVNGPDNLSFEVSTALLGECNVSDLLAAIVIALKLGMKPQKIKTAISSLTPVEHRLSIKQTPGKVTIIDDAFNSNPYGARMAADVLSQFKSGKRIIITPGMVELGDKQYELNREFGEYLGSDNRCDIIFIVGQTNRDSLVEGIKSTEFDSEKLYVTDNFQEAQEKLQPILSPGDTVLYENDLPDSFK